MLQRLLSYLGIRAAEIPEDLQVDNAAEIPEDLVAEIPEDLQNEILSRVPAKLVTRFRGLSKFHRTLIDSPYFIRNHWESSTKRATNCNQIIVYRQNRCAQDDMVVLDLTKFGVKEERLANPLKEKYFDVIGCCDGILCLLYYSYLLRDRQILLWNPLTGSGRPIIPGKHPIDRVANYYFGHDEVTDDLKILKVLGGHECKIYSCRVGSWRKYEIDSNNWPTGSLRLSDRGIFVKGTNSVHMGDLSNNEHSRDSIIAFDFAFEKFNKIDVPLQCQKWYKNWELSKFQGNLCIISRQWEIDGFGVWVMKEYGVKESWTCLFSLAHSDLRIIKPLRFVNDGRQLLLFGDKFRSEYGLHVYDFEKKEEGKSPMLVPMIDYTYVEHFEYTPSLRRP